MYEKFKNNQTFATATICLRQRPSGKCQWVVYLPDGEIEFPPTRAACIDLLKVYGFKDAK